VCQCFTDRQEACGCEAVLYCTMARWVCASQSGGGMQPCYHSVPWQSVLSTGFLSTFVTVTCISSLCSLDFGEATLFLITEHVYRTVSHDA
jgi:hypothetical protein